MLNKPDTRIVRTYIDHSTCDHDNTQAGRKACRQGNLHANCEHDNTSHAKAWCTRRKGLMTKLINEL